MINKENYSKSFELYKNWLKVEAKKRTNVPDEFIDGMITDELVTISISRSSRDLYDFLDSIDFIVSVWHDGQGWRYRVDDKKIPVTVTVPGGRKECEERAFIEAFNRLERK